MPSTLFGPPPSYVSDGFTGNTLQQWSRVPASGTYFSKIIGISDGRGLNTVGPPPVEGNFELSDPIATDIVEGTQIGIECTYQVLRFNATTVQLKFDLHAASTGTFIASTAFQILIDDGLFHTETFLITGLSLTQAQSEDLAIKMSASGGGWVLPLDAFINVDAAIPELTYSALVPEAIKVGGRSPIATARGQSKVVEVIQQQSRITDAARGSSRIVSPISGRSRIEEVN